MRIKSAVSCLALVLSPLSVVLPRTAAAQVNVEVQVGAPTIRFETAPALVEVSPGVQVVEDYDQEVYFVDGWYWYRSGPNWYRTRDHHGGWAVVHEREVPRNLVRIPPGRYRHYRGHGPHGNPERHDMGPHHGEVRREHVERRNDHQEHRQEHRQEQHEEHQEHKEHQEQHKEMHR
jgi:hypothetical protein